jgi:glucose-1-phosphate adenylyltransferase
LNDVWIGPGAVVDMAILDNQVSVGSGATVGFGDDYTVNQLKPEWLNTGLTVVGERAQIPPGARLGRNVMVNPDRDEAHYPDLEVPSGQTV